MIKVLAYIVLGSLCVILAEGTVLMSIWLYKTIKEEMNDKPE